MKLCCVFSDHAVFQALTTITLRGETDAKGSVVAEIIRNGEVISSGSAEIEDTSYFEVSVNTPEASVVPCTVRVRDALGETVINDVLFGEVWFCSGQSNMELPNIAQPECDEMMEKIKGLPIRMYFQDYGPDDAFSITPEYDRDGKWSTSDVSDSWKRPSALATAFALDIYNRLKAIGKDIPIGVMDISWGGSPLRAWIPGDILMGDERVKDFLVRIDQDISEEKWNKRPVLFQQASALYNRRVAPVVGVKARGLLWYQGECDAWNEPIYKMYAYMFKMYYEYYSKLFGADPENCPLVASLCYPWTYGESGESRLSYVNAAFVDAAEMIGEKMSFVTLADLSSVWCDVQENHPIHPTHKYALARRMAAIAYANTYDKAGTMQKYPATLESAEIKESSILVKFKNVGGGLYTNDKKQIRCLYIAGADEYYIPAESRIISPDTLEVFHPYLKDPKHVSLGWSDYEIGFNLMAGEYPVAPFATNMKQGEIINIQAKPFINHDLDAVWTFKNCSGYYRPIWYPLSGSSVCHDNAFVQSGYSRSILVVGEENTFGARVRSVDFNELDLQRYAFAEIDIHHRVPISAKLELVYSDDAESTTVEAQKMGSAGGYFERLRFELSSVKEGKISEMRLIFTTETDEPYFRFANVGRITLAPKGE